MFDLKNQNETINYFCRGFDAYSPMNCMAAGKCTAKSCEPWSVIGICRYLIVPDDSYTFGRSGVTFNMYFMLYFCNAFESSLCDALPRNRPGIISAGSSVCCGCVELSQSDDSAELLHAESECGDDIRSDLLFFRRVEQK